MDQVQLIWDNCKVYNAEGPFYILADKMERSFKKMIKNYLPNIQVVVPSNFGLNQNQSIPDRDKEQRHKEEQEEQEES